MPFIFTTSFFSILNPPHMSSETDTSSDKDVASPNYSWQDDSSSKSLSSQRAVLDILNSNVSTTYDFCKKIFRDHYCSPVSSQLTSGARVLHVSASDTQWVQEMSEAYPNSNFEYIAIVATSTIPEDFPDNIKYYSWNVEEKIFYPDCVFDFVNVDSMIAHLRAEEWRTVLLELFRIIKPGGFIELFETELWGGNMGPVNEIFITTLIYSLRARGVYARAGRELGNLLEEAGFIDITHYYVSVAIGWGSAIGRAYGQLVKRVIAGMFPFIMKSFGWTEERLLEERAKIEEEWIEFESYNNLYKAYAQRP